jgi:steroid delta-isomerase-like uncharacterized protein
VATEDILNRLQDAINRHDANAVAALYAQDAVVEDPFQNQPLRGRDSIRKDADEFLKAFPNMQFRFSNAASNGSMVGAEVDFTGTHTGPITGPQGTIQPTGRSVRIRGAAFARVSPEGLIMEEHRYYDTADFLQQLGLAQAA